MKVRMIFLSSKNNKCWIIKKKNDTTNLFNSKTKCTDFDVHLHMMSIFTIDYRLTNFRKYNYYVFSYINLISPPPHTLKK